MSLLSLETRDRQEGIIGQLVISLSATDHLPILSIYLVALGSRSDRGSDSLLGLRCPKPRKVAITKVINNLFHRYLP